MGEMVDSLGISWQGLVVQLINFTVILVVLGLVFYKPLLKMLDERTAKIKEGLEKSDEAEKRAADIDVEAKKALDQARLEGQAMIAQANEMGNRVREEAKVLAKKEAEALIEHARSAIQLEKDQAISELRKEFADITILAAGKVINQELDTDKHRKVIDEVLAASTLKGKE